MTKKKNDTGDDTITISKSSIADKVNNVKRAFAAGSHHSDTSVRVHEALGALEAELGLDPKDFGDAAGADPDEENL